MHEEKEESRNGNSERIRSDSRRGLYDRNEMATTRLNTGGSEGAASAAVSGSHLPSSERCVTTGVEAGAEKGQQTGKQLEQEGRGGDCADSRSIDPFKLPFVTMDRRLDLPKRTTGLYFVIEANNTIAYIGQSKDIRGRWAAHQVTECFNSPQSVRIAWFALAVSFDAHGFAQLHDLERAMIRRFRPRLNAVYEEVGPSSFKLVEFEETPTSGLLTAREYSEQTGISYPVVIRLLRSGAIPCQKNNFGIWRIPSSAVAEMSAPDRKPKRGWKKGRKRKPGAGTQAE